MPSLKTRPRTRQSDATRGQEPKATEGTARARPGFDQPGIPGDGLVLPQREKAEIERRAAAFCRELRPSGEVGQVLVRHAATMSVRMERCVTLENAAMTERVRRAILEFVPPEGVEEAEAARLRAEAGTQAMFDTSKEASQARRYEVAAERSFFRSLRELQRLEKAAKEAEAEAEAESEAEMTRELLASFSQIGEEDVRLNPMFEPMNAPTPLSASCSRIPANLSTLGGRMEVPVTIGRGR